MVFPLMKKMVYRTSSGKWGFATAVPAANRIKSKIDSELLSKWKNNIKEIIKIPQGTELSFLIMLSMEEQGKSPDCHLENRNIL